MQGSRVLESRYVLWNYIGRSSSLTETSLVIKIWIHAVVYPGNSNSEGKRKRIQFKLAEFELSGSIEVIEFSIRHRLIIDTYWFFNICMSAYSTV